MKALPVLLLASLTLGFPAAVRKPTFEVQGVCAIDAQTVACWAPDGGPKPGLTDEVRRRVAATAVPLSFVPGRKNRFAILRSEPYESYSYVGSYRLFLLDPDAPAPISALRVAVSPDEATASMTLTVGRLQGAAVDVPFRAGAKAVVDGVRVELGPVESNSPGSWLGGAPLRGPWRLSLGIDETTPPTGLRIEPIGRGGKPILYADPEGRPVNPKRAEAFLKEASRSPRNRAWPPPVRPVSTLVGPSQPLAWAGLMVDPKEIRALRMRRVVHRTETLGPFALDPVSETRRP